MLLGDARTRPPGSVCGIKRMDNQTSTHFLKSPMSSATSTPPPEKGSGSGRQATKISGKAVLLGLGLTAVFVSTAYMATKMYRGDEPVEEEKVVITKAPLLSDRATSSLGSNKEFVAKVTCDRDFARGSLMDTSHVRLPRGTLTISNRHHYEMMVMFYSMSDNERMQAVGLNPMESLTVKAPVGKYKVVVLTGEDWCNMETGFNEGGVKVNLDGMMLISEDRRPTITFTSEGSAPKDFASKLSVGRLDEETVKRELAKDFRERNLSLEELEERKLERSGGRGAGQGENDQKPVRKVSGSAPSVESCSPGEKQAKQPASDVEVMKSGKLVLTPSPDGYYYMTGSVNGFPTVFSYMPSEPMVSISQSTASRAGIRACLQSSNGRAGGGANKTCVARVSSLAVGGFKLRNVDVSIQPVQNADSIIGMNALREFRIEQSGNSISIEKVPLPVVANAR